MNQLQDRTHIQICNRQLLTCKHGLDDSCWWCRQEKGKENRPLETRLADVEEKADALRDILKLVLHKVLGTPVARGGGFVSTIDASQNPLIRQGVDVNKPAGGGGLAFYYSTDVG